MRLIPLAITAAMLAALLAGCAGIEGKQVANPSTVVRVDPSSRSIEFANNKDVDLTLGGATFSDKDGRSFTLTELAVKDNASAVRAANVPQIQADTERLIQQYIGIVNWSNSIWTGVNQLAATVAPYVPQTVMASALSQFRSLSTPWGGYQSGVGTLPGIVPTPIDPADLAALKAEVEALKKQLAEATSKPSE